MQGAEKSAAENIAKAALVGGVIAGAVDISYAIVVNLANVSPSRVLQSVASGLLGRDSFEGGLAIAAAGLALHFAMTILMALLFIIGVRAFAPLRRHVIAAGLLYGAAIFFVMRWIVVPLSRFPGDLRHVYVSELVVHILGVGLVIALAAQWLGALSTGSRLEPVGAAPASSTQG